MIRVQRVYEARQRREGKHFLVDRLWPRGIKRDTLRINGWLKDAAPTETLRRWFGHCPDRWDEFRRRYFLELDGKPESWELILKAARQGTVTLLYAARDVRHNNAVALRDYLMDKFEAD
ncbi:MAG: DUF488 domain-containing protein [Candidatus Binatia bacterium]